MRLGWLKFSDRDLTASAHVGPNTVTFSTLCFGHLTITHVIWQYAVATEATRTFRATTMTLAMTFAMTVIVSVVVSTAACTHICPDAIAFDTCGLGHVTVTHVIG